MGESSSRVMAAEGGATWLDRLIVRCGRVDFDRPTICALADHVLARLVPVQLPCPPSVTDVDISRASQTLKVTGGLTRTRALRARGLENVAP